MQINWVENNETPGLPYLRDDHSTISLLFSLCHCEIKTKNKNLQYVTRVKSFLLCHIGPQILFLRSAAQHQSGPVRHNICGPMWHNKKDFTLTLIPFSVLLWQRSWLLGTRLERWTIRFNTFRIRVSNSLSTNSRLQFLDLGSWISQCMLEKDC